LAAFDVEGTGRIVTPPFVARAPFDEVVLEVAGQPRPMGRPFTLWNRWVQHDPRVLALGVSDVETRPEGQAIGPEGEIARRWSPEEIRARFLYDGLHGDDWIGRRFVVTVPSRARRARVGLSDFGGPQPIRVTVDGTVRVADLQPSQPQIVDVDLPGLAPGDGHVIALEFTRWHEQGTTSRPDLDRRREAARLLWLDLQ
jgi:hypothetical protein